MSNKIEKPIKISPTSMNRLLQKSNVQELIDTAIAAIPPVVIPCPYEPGDIYKTTSPAYNTPAKVAARWPGTTWESWAEGRVPVGMGSNGVTNYTIVEATGGVDAVALTSAQNGTHTHTFTGASGATGTESTGHTHSTPAHTHTIKDPGHSHFTAKNNETFATDGGWEWSLATSETNATGPRLTSRNATNISIPSSGGGTSGAKSGTHTHTITPAGTNSSSGSGTEHENRMPYETCYMWKRLT